jgi:hypothetical protein
MRAPTFNFFQDLSAAYTGALNERPSANQVRSPKDKMRGRVCAKEKVDPSLRSE